MILLRIGDASEDNVLFGISATESFRRSLKSEVAKHPLDSGASITDHVSNSNAMFEIRGVLSSCDTSFIKHLVRFEYPDSDELEVPYNFNIEERPKFETEDEKGGFLKSLIPDVIGQFLNDGMEVEFNPDGVVDYTDYAELIYDRIEKYVTQLVYDVELSKYSNSIRKVTLYEMQEQYVKRVYEDLVITSFNREDTPDNGEGVYFNMTLEQVRTPVLVEVEVDIPQAKKTVKKSKPDSDSSTLSGLDKDQLDEYSRQCSNPDPAYGITEDFCNKVGIENARRDKADSSRLKSATADAAAKDAALIGQVEKDRAAGGGAR